MALKKIEVKQFRNINQAILEMSPQFNIITGENGAGKTSLLEAIFFVARGRSFRSGDPRNLIQKGEEFFEIVMRTDDDHIAGIRRYQKQMIARCDGEPVTRLSGLAKILPVFTITPKSHELVEGVPEIRRGFVDWGLFHVEHQYSLEMQNYRKILRQRNAALRQSAQAVLPWTQGLVEAAEKITARREAFITKLELLFQSALSEISDLKELELGYSRGWTKGESLADLLDQRVDQDMERGFTTVGPHRSDLQIRYYGKIAKDGLSRGQQKIVATALILAQVMRLSEDQTNRPVLLLDDFSSELDSAHQSRLLAFLDSIQAQKIITVIEDTISPLVTESRLFHVEHGTLV